MAMFEVVAAVLSVVGGMTAALQFLLGRVYQRKARAATQEVLYEAAVSEALNADQIETLGAYLEERLGSITVAEYAADETIRTRVSSFVNKISQFLELPEKEAPAELPETQLPREPEDEKLKEIGEMIRSDRVWDGLARLRRIIEMRLRNLAADTGMSVGKMSAGRLLQLLKPDLAWRDAVEFLEYAISVANRAVHGEDVSVGEALQAVWAASSGLELLKGPEGDQGEL